MLHKAHLVRTVVLLFLFFTTLFLSAVNSTAQQYFTASGDFTRAMHIHPVEAKLNGVSLSVGDEVGIFDDSHCAGVVVLTSELGELTDTEVAHGMAGADDQTTSDTDGFTPGNRISFRVWDKSEGREIIDVEAIYYNSAGNQLPVPVFETGQTVFVSLKATYNTAPIANAGNDFTVDENTPVQLDGSGSSDNEGNSLNYTWNDIDGIGLISTGEVKPAFTAPKVSSDSEYRISLTVNDGILDSEPDTITITVKNVPKPPVADAGANFNVEEGGRGRLDGSGSFDPEGLDLTYSWKIIPADFMPDSPNLSVTRFTAPKVTKDQKYLAVLRVTNSSALSDTDTAFITVTNHIEPPVADAGSDLTVKENSGSYQLDGSGSHDPQNRILTYKWNDLDNLGLTATATAFPSFNSPKVEQDTNYRIILSVDNGVLISEPDTMIITVTANKAPVIVTELNADTDELTEVVLDASASHDPDKDELTFLWSVFYYSQKDLVVFDDETSSAPTLSVGKVNEDQTVRIELLVSDGKDHESVLIDLHINNINHTPVAEAGSHFSMDERSTTYLDGTGSFDEDDDSCSYYWYSEELTIHDATSATPEITAPEVEEDKTVRVVLTVSDGVDESRPDTIQITITNVNRIPVANAGEGKEVEEGEVFTLDGSGSYDPDGDVLTYQWSMPELLKGSLQSAALSTTAPQVENDTVFKVILIVSDGEAISQPDTAFVTVKQVNQSPQFAPVPSQIAHAGHPFSAEVKVSDPDLLDKVVIFSDDLPTWLKLVDLGSRKALLSADPVPRDENLLGSHSFVLQASDGIETVELNVTITVTVQTGAEDFQVEKVKVYPNPASGILFVDFNRMPESETLLYLYNSEGKVILSHRANRQNLKLNLEEEPAGFYYLKIQSADYAYTKKIIIQNNSY